MRNWRDGEREGKKGKERIEGRGERRKGNLDD